MGYLLLATIFYTVVKFSVDVWLQLRYERSDSDKRYELEEQLRNLQRETLKADKAL